MTTTPRPIFAPGSPLANVIASCERLAATDATVLLLGETGTGKEVFARLVHAKSARANAPMVAVNCGAIPEHLLEAELFGHAKGAFTSADRARKGRVAMAEGGTLFLDEIGEMPVALQVKLLRLLQEKTYEPVGDAQSVHANFRLIAATNRDLEKEVEAGRFRRDLFYRLCVCPVNLPALRQRPDDVEAIFRALWAQRGEARAIADTVMARLRAYAWPGNVRELENLVERLSICSLGDTIVDSDLPAHIVATLGAAQPALAAVSAVAALAPVAAPVASIASIAPVAPIEAPVLHTPAFGMPMPPPSAFPASSFKSAVAALAPPKTGADRVLQAQPEKPMPPTTLGPVSLTDILRDVEYQWIDAALAQTQGNRQAAANLLGLQRTTLVEKLRRRDRDEQRLSA